MYCQYFSLKKKPFQINSDNAFLWLGIKQEKALKVLKTGMAQNQGLLTLIGDVGTGKTTLINEIIHTLDNETLHVKIEDPYFETNQIYQVIALTLGFEHQDQEKFSSTFYAFLESINNTKKAVIIVDEAQRISQRLLKEIISWSKFGFNRTLTIILSGQLEFQDLIKTNQGLALHRHIKVNALLEPLNKQETKAYIERRLELAGTKRNIFLKTSIPAIHKFSKGIPRLINIACDQALIEAFVNNMKTVDGTTFQKAINPLALPNVQSEKQLLTTGGQSLENRSPQSIQRFVLKLFASLVAAACICLAYLFYNEYLPFATKKPLTSTADNLDNNTTNEPMDVKPVKQRPVGEQSVIQSPIKVLPVKQEHEQFTPSEPVDPLLDVTAVESGVISNQVSTDLSPEKSDEQEISLDYIHALPENEIDDTSIPVREPDPEAIINWLLERNKSN